MSRSGSCLCGAVTFKIASDVTDTGACHCDMCRKWSGGVYLGIEVAPDNMSIEGAGNITHFASSEWAERGFCRTCGSSLFYRITSPGPHSGTYHVAMGALDDTSGIDLKGEVFIDSKPDGYSFAEKTEQFTGAELMAMFAPPA
ncbi:Glutathione-dependent formaldehyde-activating enzyme [Ascidiaceihabitans donghaensis]|uniref:Glutathione-dependent formaldehyde-activating enzyme n=1 Tax=Ascidiaceihabitans donghaensis TaxID=1510460 RepID=A0A2R8BIY4_9RHOB|nr:GFA family protein [Ascidiaceihabitans donghaensis]SPH22981.1 Glutathione-dependent formaldehyde-activating enzyme [Ascidiaceihabitans donghaensis]